MNELSSLKDANLFLCIHLKTQAEKMIINYELISVSMSATDNNRKEM